MSKHLLVLVGLPVTRQLSSPEQVPWDSSRADLGESQEEIIRVDTNLDTIPASVMDRDGKNIPNLKKQDLQIFEDGCTCEGVLSANAEFMTH
jgi:hypothetical protein